MQMRKEKKYFYTWEDSEEKGKSAQTMAEEMLADEELPTVENLIIGSWGASYEESCQPIIDCITEHKEKFSHIKSLYIGDMDYEECEVSWIIQGNFERLWDALPDLKELTIKGSTGLSLGNIRHAQLERLEIICGGLPSGIIQGIQSAWLPKLKALTLYLGSSDYGFDGSGETIRQLLSGSDFPELEELGICDSEIQDEVTRLVLESKYAAALKKLDLSKGTLSDLGGRLLADALPGLSNLTSLDLNFHYLSDEGMDRLRRVCDRLSVRVGLEWQQEEDVDEDDGEIYRYPMLTE